MHRPEQTPRKGGCSLIYIFEGNDFARMDMKLSLKEIAEITGADLVGSLSCVDSPAVDSLLTDSRSFRIGPGTLFFALSTPSGDGHNFIPSLYSRGVRAFVVNRLPDGEFPEAVFLVVPSPLKALQTLGAEMRARSHAKVLGITGSKGKWPLTLGWH